jgi:hypothetical protein
MMIAAYRAARLNQRLNPRTAPVASIRVDGEANSPSPDASLGTPPAQDTVETSEPIMGGVNELMTAPAPLPDDVVVPSHPEPYIAHTEPMVDAEPARTEPALAEIGLGPSMLLRLNQIGLRSVHDVARAKPDDLRAALGSSSRLLNVEAWISNARHLTATGCTV